MKTYKINEIFYSLQGEGIRSGEPSIFVRFAFCNMKCELAKTNLSPGGFNCDTEFTSYRSLTLDEIDFYIKKVSNNQCKWIIATGGEPALQLDKEFIDWWHSKNGKIAIETNGSIKLPEGIDWITVSPKVAEHCIKQLKADEVKYVRSYGQPIPNAVVEADYYLISPAFNGNYLDKQTLDWCVKLVQDNPKWRFTTQLHKVWNIL